MLKVQTILWGAITSSTFVFLVILITVRPPDAAPPEPMMLPVFALVALTTAVLSFVIPATQLRQALAQVKLETVDEADPQASDIIPYRDAPKRRAFKNPEAAQRRAIAIWQTPFILSLALSESVALFGFTTGFMGFDLRFAIPFFVVSWILLGLRFPTPDKVLGPFEAASGAKFPGR